MGTKDSVPAIKTMDATTKIILINFHQIFPPMTLIFNKENSIAKYSNSCLQPTILQTKIKGMSFTHRMNLLINKKQIRIKIKNF
jgi:hypothetical protein